MITEVKKCLVSCLKSEPANTEELRQRLVNQLSQPAVMGSLYRLLWVDELGVKNYFINIASYLEDSSGRCRPVLAWAVRKKVKSLREICLEVISETMTSGAREEIQTLGLPHSLEENLCELMAKL